jgi:hypothetical protein
VSKDRENRALVRPSSQIPALDRSQPSLPMKKGRGGTLTHDYKRNGMTTLFAALDAATGKVTGMCLSRHRHKEFLVFLKIIDGQVPKGLDFHLLDNYGTHNHPNVKTWLAKQPRFYLHFTPTSSSWLNLVERWFREFTEKAIRGGVFRSVDHLIAAIDDYLDAHNAVHLDSRRGVDHRESRTRSRRPPPTVRLMAGHCTSIARVEVVTRSQTWRLTSAP